MFFRERFVRLATTIFMTALLAGLLLAARPAAAEKVPFDITMMSEAGNPLHTLADAQHLLALPSAPSILLDAHSMELRFGDYGDQSVGPFGFNKPFPSRKHFDHKNFALETSAWIDVPTAGDWTFGVASDDGFSMTVDGQTFEHSSRRATRITVQTVDFPTAGDYPIQVTYFQHLKQDELEVFAAPGAHTRFGRRQGFHLINADAFEALQLVDAPSASDPPDPTPPTLGNAVPEPATFSFLGMSVTMLLLRRKR
jgi:hypothetical protein